MTCPSSSHPGSQSTYLPVLPSTLLVLLNQSSPFSSSCSLSSSSSASSSSGALGHSHPLRRPPRHHRSPAYAATSSLLISRISLIGALRAEQALKSACLWPRRPRDLFGGTATPMHSTRTIRCGMVSLLDASCMDERCARLAHKADRLCLLLFSPLSRVRRLGGLHLLPALIICLEVLQLLCHVSGEPFLPFFAHAGSAAARSAAWRTVHLRGSIKPSRTPLRITIDQPILATIVVVVYSCRDEWHAHESRPPAYACT